MFIFRNVFQHNNDIILDGKKFLSIILNSTIFPGGRKRGRLELELIDGPQKEDAEEKRHR